MTANVRTMAYRNAVPWHGLGSRLHETASLEQWTQDAGLDFNVYESLVYYTTPDAEVKVMPKRKVLYRSDTHEPLSVVSSQFKLDNIQPPEILGFYRDLVNDMGFVMESAGVLGNGQKVWALARTGEVARLNGQDEVRQYLLLATAYDLSFATTGAFTAVRVVCENTLRMALSQAVDAVKIGHRSQFNPTEVKAQLGLSAECFDAFRRSAELLTRVKVDAREAHRFYRELFNLSPKDANVPEKRKSELAVADTLRDRFNTSTYTGGDLESSSNTAWGLVNVVTEYLDHVRRETKKGSRLNSAWFGPGAALKKKAWENALELVTV